MRTLALANIGFVGQNLSRPECVLACQSGMLYLSDGRGGVTGIAPTGEQSFLGAAPIVPNGIALLRDGSFAVANLLEDNGGVWLRRRDGVFEPWITEIDGRTLGSVNFVWLDHEERLWICVSSRTKFTGTYDRHSSDGYIAIHDGRGSRIVAEGLTWTNECRLDPQRNVLVVNETFGRRLTRFHVRQNGDLYERHTLAEFGKGDFPDGMAIDEEGGVWIASIVSNRIIRVEIDGTQRLVLEDPSPESSQIEDLYLADQLTRTRVTAARGSILSNVSSIAFGGPNLKQVFLGSLGGNAIATFNSSVAGIPPVHWTW